MNGRKICKSLREIRLLIASANDIDYTPAVCSYEGDVPALVRGAVVQPGMAHSSIG